MKLIRNISAFALAISLGLAPAAHAQETEGEEAPHPFISAISENVLDATRGENGELSGPGWEILAKEAEAAQFFLIGETHSTADIALTAGAIHRAIAPKGYHHLVVEIGPWSTRHTERLIREGALTDYLSTPGNQFNIPFLSSTEEIEFVEQAVRLSPHYSPVLWGVDQEFIAAGPIIASELARLAQTEDQRTVAEDFAAKAHGNFMYLAAATQEDIDALSSAFGNSEEARSLIDGIALTHRVYGPFVRGAGPIYPANLERENYMKANFLQHFRAAEERMGEAPKALFKFGGFHLERGLSGTNVPSFGNFVMEWGRAHNFGTVHVMIDCLSGEAWSIQQNRAAPCKPYGLDEDSPLLAALEDSSSAIINLKALRPLLRSNTPIDAKTRDLILSYDYYWGLRDVRAGTPVANLTFPPAPRQ